MAETQVHGLTSHDLLRFFLHTLVRVSKNVIEEISWARIREAESRHFLDSHCHYPSIDWSLTPPWEKLLPCSDPPGKKQRGLHLHGIRSCPAGPATSKTGSPSRIVSFSPTTRPLPPTRLRLLPQRSSPTLVSSIQTYYNWKRALFEEKIFPIHRKAFSKNTQPSERLSCLVIAPKECFQSPGPSTPSVIFAFSPRLWIQPRKFSVRFGSSAPRCTCICSFFAPN